MPQAMEWSLATPITNPRLPFISPVFGISPDFASAKRSSRGVFCSIRTSLLIALEDQRGVGAAKAEAVGQSDIDVGVVDAAAHDIGAFHRGVEIDDIGTLANEACLHH